MTKQKEENFREILQSKTLKNITLQSKILHYSHKWVIAPVEQAQNQDPFNPQNPQDTNPHHTFPTSHLYQIIQHICKIFQSNHQILHQTQSSNKLLQDKMPQLSWSYFKPEFSGKPEEDAIAHLFRTNNWMETHNFPEDEKVQRFCLTLTGEARLWHETLGPIEVDWTGIQEHFRQQYSKFGNRKGQLFHV